MYRKGENRDGEKNVGSVLSAAIGFQRKLPGLYITGALYYLTFCVFSCNFFILFLLLHFVVTTSFNFIILLRVSRFQVTVWGDYGRIEGKKVFMGIAQIVLDELDLRSNQMVIGWYKLFDTQALVSGAPSLALSRRSSVTSLDFFKI